LDHPSIHQRRSQIFMGLHLIEATLLLLFLTTIAVPWARRTGLPTEILLVVGSLALSLLPGLPPLVLDPTVVFTLFLPPILFAAAYFTSWRDFKQNRRPIFLLAFGLVLFTTTLVAVAVRFLGLGVPWPVAFLLGAIVSPPDASAATAVIRKLGVPRRLVTVIEGESLVNDATALVAYRFALMAIATGSFSLGAATLRFVLVAVGGTAIGLLVGVAGIFIVKRLKDSAAETTLTLVTSFATYILAEHLGFSGVIATVVGGLYYGRKIPTVTSAETRITAEASWTTVLFIINGLVFTLIGLQMPAVMAGLGSYSWRQLALYGVTVVLVVMAVRFIWVFPATYLPRKLFRSIARKDPLPPWGVVTALSWAGMRGIVSLAAALSIPLTLPSGEEFPFRNLLIFLTYVVILITLVIPATTLPWLMQWLGIKDGGESRRDEAVARLALLEAVLREIDSLKSLSQFSAELLENTAQRHQRRVQTLRSNLEPNAFSPLFDEDQTLRRLTRKLLGAERKELASLRRQAIIHDEVFFQLSHELDIEETRLSGQRI
jgi:monovalent cation/hydrogen antiporter